MTDALLSLLATVRSDPTSSYRKWFLTDSRFRSFRSVRIGLKKVASDIDSGTFGNAYRGSCLEEVMQTIIGQGRATATSDCVLWWRPKLRSPDIYENPDHQRAFGRLLDVCLNTTDEQHIISAIRRLDALGIRGLGPSCANLLYFLHPTVLPLYSEAIVRGFYRLTNEIVRCGRWSDYFTMRCSLIRLNTRYRRLLSADLGAVCSLLYDVGTGRYPAPPRELAHDNLPFPPVVPHRFWSRSDTMTQQLDCDHTKVQEWLRDLGLCVGFDVWVAPNDRSKALGSGRLGDRCVSDLACIGDEPCADVIRFIDILWLNQSSGRIVAAFEVEHTTSIVSGWVRLVTLAHWPEPQPLEGLFIVAPDNRQKEVAAQMSLPIAKSPAAPPVFYLPYSILYEKLEVFAQSRTAIDMLKAASCDIRSMT